jgi:hypothetical protein
MNKALFSLFILLSVAFSFPALAFNKEDLGKQINDTCERREKEAGRMTITGMESCMKYQAQSLHKISLYMEEMNSSPKAANLAFKGCLTVQLKKNKTVDFSRLSSCVKAQKEALFQIKTALQSEKSRDNAETCLIKASEMDYKRDEILYHVGRCLEKNDNIIVVRGKTNLQDLVYGKASDSTPVNKQVLVSNGADRLPASTASSCGDHAKMKEDFYFSCRGLYAVSVEERREEYRPEKATQICKCLVSRQRDIASLGSESCQVPKDVIRKMLADHNLVLSCEANSI